MCQTGKKLGPQNKHMKYNFNIFIVISLFILVGCASCLKKNAFVLSDDTALKVAIDTKYVINLTKKYPNTKIFIEEGNSKIDRYVYIGFDEGTHTTRYASLRVDAQGVVYKNSDPTLLTEKWVVLK